MVEVKCSFGSALGPDMSECVSYSEELIPEDVCVLLFANLGLDLDLETGFDSGKRRNGWLAIVLFYFG